MKNPTAKTVKKIKKTGEMEYKVWTVKTDFKWPETIVVPVNIQKDFLEKANNSLCDVVKWCRAFDLGYKCAGGESNKSMQRLVKNLDNLSGLHEILQSNLIKANENEKENKITEKK